MLMSMRKVSVSGIEAIIEPFNNEVSTENNRLARSIRVVNEKVNAFLP